MGKQYPADPGRRRLLYLLATACAAPFPVNAADAASGLSVSTPLAPVLLPVEGRLLLVYELHLANQATTPRSLASLRITGPAGRVLAHFEEAALASRMAPLDSGAPPADTALLIPPGRRAIVYIELELDAAPAQLMHEMSFRGAESAAPAHAIAPENPMASLGPPLAGGPWVAIHAPEWPRGHRRVVYATDGVPRIPGRYAIDFVRVDGRGRTGVAGSERVRDVLGYGAPVLAVADGVIASTRDDMAESATLSANRKHAQADATGNYVSLRLADGRVVFYEHLKPGSVRVKPGQQVNAGQVIGALGFTGDSTGPHLHFSVAAADSPLGAEGLAFTFERFALLGRYADLGQLGKAPWQALARGTAPGRRHEWPGWNTVLRFAGQPRPG